MEHRTCVFREGRQMNVTSHDSKNVSDVEPRTVRALEEYLTVMPEHGRVKGADDLVLVVSASPEEYRRRSFRRV